MKLVQVDLQDVYIIENFNVKDGSGEFTKTYHEEFFNKNNLCNYFKESYFSVSRKNVIRGMHFQLPLYDNEELDYVATGEILDVIVDLRKLSNTHGKSISVTLSENNHRSVYIPKGSAHGFKTNTDNTITIYNVSSVYNKESDFGIKFDSFNFVQNIDNPILSDRDKNFISFKEFDLINPF